MARHLRPLDPDFADYAGIAAALRRPPPAPPRPAACHPDRGHRARELCDRCYHYAYNRGLFSSVGRGSGEVVVVVPMLGRPHRVVPLLASIVETTPQARVLFVLSPGDRQVQRVLEGLDQEAITVPYQPRGDYARKINAGYRHTTEALIFCGADDLQFHAGWFEAAVAKLVSGIGVVGTNDLGSPRVMAGEHATHSLVTRDYADQFGVIDQPGQILYEGYIHEWVDDELVGTAKYRGAWSFAVASHVEHLHPNWGKAPTDALYAAQRVRMSRGRRLFLRRKALWHG